ncbi:MAG TPA: tRNA epoxyqueuosine(34) reductase QueG [Bacteroidales bacterium]|nr:tRNA epoxyqueuosine(34) reductase QueG [Bacteroidales bacterium]
MSPHDLAILIKEKATSLGFSDCGIAAAQYLEDEANRLTQWLNNSFQADMGYMSRNFEKRTDPRLLVEGARSVIVLLFNYFPAEDVFKDSRFRISKYAFGNDYHDVIRARLNKLCDELLKIDEKVVTRAFVDSAPVLERAWATRAGLGWIGKNSMLITRKSGSFFFIATIITSLEPEYDKPYGGNYCGDCTRCIDACPMAAIVAPAVVDANRCISFLTIENKNEIPEKYRGRFDNWIFGCDICQDVCPWNRYSHPNSIAEFMPSAELAAMKADDWTNLSEEKYRLLFKSSAVKRCKFDGLKRNIDFVNAHSTHDHDKE